MIKLHTLRFFYQPNEHQTLFETICSLSKKDGFELVCVVPPELAGMNLKDIGGITHVIFYRAMADMGAYQFDPQTNAWFEIPEEELKEIEKKHDRA